MTKVAIAIGLTTSKKSAPIISSVSIRPVSGQVGEVFAADVITTGWPLPRYSYQWKLDGADVPGGDAAGFTVPAAGRLSVLVTANNESGSDARESGAVEVAPALVAPAVTRASISPSSGSVGDVFTVSATATGDPSPALAYQWTLDGVAIDGATASSHAAAVEGTLGVVVTARNSAGTDSLAATAVSVGSSNESVFVSDAFGVGIFV